MKLKIIIIIIVLFVSGCDINIYTNPKTNNSLITPNNQINNQENNSIENRKEISIQDAKNIVLNDVGFKENQVVFIKEQKYFENNGIEFEFEFINNNIKYEYTINQVGNIIKKEQENILID